MSFLRQVLVGAVLLGLGIVGLANVSEDARAILRRAGLDPAVVAFVATTQDPAARPPGPGPGAQQAPVVTAAVTEAPAATRLRTIGTGRAVRSVTLFPQSSGIVAAMDFTAGASVEAGHVLLSLDQESEAIAVARAEIAREAAAADVERMTALANRNATTLVTLEQARRALQTAELNLRDARLALERRLVRAPFNGVPGLSEVEPGDYIGTSTAIAAIDDRSRIEIDLNAPERFASLVRLGQPVSATTIAVPGETFAGEITAIDSQVDAESRTLRLRATLANPGDLLRPGFSFAVTLDFPGEQHAAVPALAVQWRSEGPYVWKVAEGKAALVPVEVVERSGETALVRGDIRPGERVVTEGVQRLRPGAVVAEMPPAKEGT